MFDVFFSIKIMMAYQQNGDLTSKTVILPGTMVIFLNGDQWLAMKWYWILMNGD